MVFQQLASAAREVGGRKELKERNEEKWDEDGIL